LEVNVTADDFLAQRLPTLLVDHTGAEDRAHGDRLGDMVEDRIAFALH
jgi:hypothetical protein